VFHFADYFSDIALLGEGFTISPEAFKWLSTFSPGVHPSSSSEHEHARQGRGFSPPEASLPVVSFYPGYFYSPFQETSKSRKSSFVR